MVVTPALFSDFHCICLVMAMVKTAHYNIFPLADLPYSLLQLYIFLLSYAWTTINYSYC